MSTSGRVTHIDIDIETLSIEAVQPSVDQNIDQGAKSVHVIGNDSWLQVGTMFSTTFNCGFILSYSSIIMVPLGWKWGIISLIAVGLYSLYANWLLASFHYIEGKRFIRYRDLVGYALGKPSYYIIWVAQFLTLILVNMGFILLGGRALKEMNSELNSSPIRLQYFIIVAGVAYFLFSVCIPTMSAMRVWLGLSAALTAVYIATSLSQCIHDGGNPNPNRNYEVSGTDVGKMFNAFNAISALVAVSSSGMLPEAQSTLKEPAVKNMRKALLMQFTLGCFFYYGIAIVGYWAYGTSVSSYLPQNFAGPTWVKVLTNVAVFLQFIVSQSMFAAPVHEFLDTRYLDPNHKIHSKQNILRLLGLRAIFFSVNTLVAAAFPFVADFVSLIGSFMLIPLTFLFPSLVFLKVKAKTARIEKKIWHWFNVILFSLLTIITSTATVRLIIKDVSTYSVFSNA
ncbi:hypothetical protein K2173_026438 [Erythroxylum novogranatense]|uniref:Amino acid transporter transmembrane domain-containing protein n=1 Tax=Erythroxylum novogranatense TaxID=1862640 RepID=A0AAV8TWA1_9ROSI|nr:hypothetical protein K2173_026438 [Erythroxylum novogranatense]